MVGRSARETRAPARRRGMHPLAVLGTVLLGVVAGLAALWGVVLIMQRLYAERILPNVYALEVDIGGLTVAQAERHLGEAADRVDAGVVTLTDGETVWEAPWRDLGMTLDADATAQAALVIGHSPADRDPRRWLQLWVASHHVEPRLRLDIERTQAVLEGLVPVVGQAPSDPQVALEGVTVVVTPGSAGSALDVPMSLQAVAAAAQSAEGGRPIALSFRSVPPASYDPSPLQAEVNSLMARTVEIAAYDLLLDRWFTWTLGRAEMAPWLRLERSEWEDTIVIDGKAVAATLTPLAAQIGEARTFRDREAVDAVAAVHAAGGGKVTLTIAYAPGLYTVRAGDAALRIAADHGMPLYALVQANPGVDLDMLSVGQELVLPSQDVLTPLLVVPHKRIVIDLGEHHLRAYENGALLYDWLVASGRDSSPTAAGTFQVLFKEESAYASNWDLTMPHFVGVYAAAPGFANGIHALPFLSNGQRLWTRALGTDVSYGCIILGVQEAETLFGWAEEGVVVVIQP